MNTRRFFMTFEAEYTRQFMLYLEARKAYTDVPLEDPESEDWFNRLMRYGRKVDALERLLYSLKLDGLVAIEPDDLIEEWQWQAKKRVG